jgi:hypothetical protein
MATPETLNHDAPQVQERQEEFIVPETLQSSGVKVVQKNFKAQVNDDKGKPLIQTPPAQIITTVQPPADVTTLTQQAKGDTTSAVTWLAAFWLRIIKKAMHFGWEIVAGSPTPPVSN